MHRPVVDRTQGLINLFQRDIRANNTMPEFSEIQLKFTDICRQQSYGETDTIQIDKKYKKIPRFG